LIEQYGQFGSGVPTRTHAEGGYDNSFIIADPTEAWILEAVGTRWVAKRISQGCRSISNQPTIRTQWDIGSLDIKDYALKKGWWPDEQRTQFDFARAYIDDQVSRQVSHIRLMRSRQLLAQKTGQITPQWMMGIARDHYEDTFLDGPYFDAANPDFHSICMHAAVGDFTWGNTASSCVAVLPKSEDELPIFWWTPGPPCNGCYLPFFVHGSKLPQTVSNAGRLGKRVIPPPEVAEDSFSSDSYWWLFKHLMDLVKGDPMTSLPNHYQIKNRIVRAKFNPLEQEFATSLPRVLGEARKAKEANDKAVAHILDEFTESCVNKVLTIIKELIEEFSSPSFIAHHLRNSPSMKEIVVIEGEG
jgi:secernin